MAAPQGLPLQKITTVQDGDDDYDEFEAAAGAEAETLPAELEGELGEVAKEAKEASAHAAELPDEPPKDMKVEGAEEGDDADDDEDDEDDAVDDDIEPEDEEPEEHSFVRRRSSQFGDEKSVKI